MRISQFKNIKQTGNPSNRSLFTVLTEIKQGEYKSLIAKIRLETDKEKRQVLKQQLPYVTFAGIFSYRRNDRLEKSSQIATLDFDDIADVEELRKKVNGDKYTLSSFVSPSGNGLKVLVKIPPVSNNQDYKDYYIKLSEYYNQYAETDPATKDIARASYLSYDPNLYLSEEPEMWVEKFEPIKKELTKATTVALTDQDKIAKILEKSFQKKYTRTNRNCNLYSYARSFNSFGLDKQLCEEYLIQYQEPDFNENEIKALINSAYRNTQEFGTESFEDREKFKKITQAVESGMSDSKIKALHQGEDKQIQQAIDEAKKSLNSEEFWSYSEKGSIKLAHNRFINYLANNNITKFYPEGSDNFIFIKKDKDFIREFDTPRIKDFVLNDLSERSEVEAHNLMAGNNNFFSRETLNMIKTSQININKDTKNEAFVYYRNTAVKITKDKIELIPYDNIEGLIWEDQVIDRDFVYKEESEGEFQKFMWLISGQDKKRYYSFKSAIGYLCHGFQNEGRPKVIIFNDEAISDVPNGGSGKGLIHKAIGRVKKLSTINGKGFDPSKQFAYQTVNTDTQVLLFDDVDKNFKFENLFSVVTEGLIIEKKGKDAIKIPFSESPKISITTNYTVKGDGSSHRRRVFELEMHNHFNDTHTPEDEFGHLLFADWDAEEWELFDAYMIRSIMYYLKNGLVDYERINLAERKLKNDTCAEFIEFMDALDMTGKTQYGNRELYEDFKNSYEEYRYEKWLKPDIFRKWLKSYCEARKIAKVETKRTSKDRLYKYISPENFEDVPF